MKLRWPWAEIQELRAGLILANKANELARAELEDMGKAWEANSAKLSEVLARAQTRIAELEAPKPESAPLKQIYCPRCPSRRTRVMFHHVAWRQDKDRAVPEPIGATCQCIDCGNLWHVGEHGSEIAKKVEMKEPPKEKRKAADDSDLSWSDR